VSRRILLAAGFAAVALATGCSGDEGDDPSAGALTDPSPTTETAEPEADLDDCAAVADSEEARACYAAALSARMRGADDPSAPLEEIAVAAYSDPTGRLLGECHGLMHFGHAFMRLVREDLAAALDLCSALGAEAPDCSQGAFHDYWFAAIGADDTTPPETLVDDPRKLCGAQAAEFVRPCWYRAFIDDRPDEPIASAADILALCDGLAGLQRQACITAASVVGPPDPPEQLSFCTELDGEDAVSCIRGTKVQNLIVSPPEDHVALIRGCDGFAAETRLACYRWLGKVLAVLTDGEFEQYGCESLADGPARRACLRGAGEIDEPLVTFS
jgi:hypothetical protein